MNVSLKKFQGFLKNGWVSLGIEYFGGVRASERRRKRGRRTDKHRHTEEEHAGSSMERQDGSERGRRREL